MVYHFANDNASLCDQRHFARLCQESSLKNNAVPKINTIRNSFRLLKFWLFECCGWIIVRARACSSNRTGFSNISVTVEIPAIQDVLSRVWLQHEIVMRMHVLRSVIHMCVYRYTHNKLAWISHAALTHGTFKSNTVKWDKKNVQTQTHENRFLCTRKAEWAKERDGI